MHSVYLLPVNARFFHVHKRGQIQLAVSFDSVEHRQHSLLLYLPFIGDHCYVITFLLNTGNLMGGFRAWVSLDN